MLPLTVARLVYYTYILIRKMLETSLLFQIALHIRKLLGLMIQRKFAIFILCEIPQSAVHDLAGDVHGLIGSDPPARRTRRYHMDIKEMSRKSLACPRSTIRLQSRLSWRWSKSSTLPSMSSQSVRQKRVRSSATWLRSAVR